MQFPQDLEASAIRTPGGEYAWSRSDALRATRALAAAGLAVLGGELWLVRGRKISGGFRTHSGSITTYHWASVREPMESWSDFLARSSFRSRPSKPCPPRGKSMLRLTLSFSTTSPGFQS